MAHKPFAVILCSFNDIPPLSMPASYFTNLITPGSYSLYDYWNQVTYGSIDLSGSKLFGPWTMQYSYFLNGANPVPKQKPRSVWISEAKRLAGINGVDLSPFYGVIAVINANADDSNWGHDVACGICWEWGQQNWRWCHKCQGLFSTHTLVTGPCPADGVHDLGSSSNYGLIASQPGVPGQNQWRQCQKCNGIYYSGNPTQGACPSGGTHSSSGGGDYTIGFGTVGYPGQNGWKWCSRCQMLVNCGTSPAKCAGGGNHDISQSADYTVFYNENNFNLTFFGHETGHAYGLGHSWNTNPEYEYGNPWDIMSAMGVSSFQDSEYPPAGPGVEAANLDFLGCIPDFALWTNGPAQVGTGTIRLLPVNAPSLGYLAAKVSRADVAYYIDYRKPTGWDHGFARDGVFVNEVRTWQWCNKCQELTSTAGLSVGQCAAGGTHDHSGSDNYTLLHDTASGGTGQSNWQWCSKCQALTYAGGSSMGVCPSGGTHSHNGSGNYTLVHDTANYGQNNWRYCRKCQALAFAGASAGTCAAGGAHDLSQSYDYDLFKDAAKHSFLCSHASANGDFQPGQVFVDKMRGLGFVVHSFDQAAPQTATVSIANLQNNWRWCNKCQGLGYGGNVSPGPCPASGSHSYVGSSDYSLLHDLAGSAGQDNWRWCKNCQGLAYGGNPNSRCPAGGAHDLSASYNYLLLHDANITDAQSNWRWCSKCQGLAFAGNSQGVCPAGGAHMFTQSGNYYLINL
jgi:hypothetical protein